MLYLDIQTTESAGSDMLRTRRFVARQYLRSRGRDESSIMDRSGDTGCEETDDIQPEEHAAQPSLPMRRTAILLPKRSFKKTLQDPSKIPPRTPHPPQDPPQDPPQNPPNKLAQKGPQPLVQGSSKNKAKLPNPPSPAPPPEPQAHLVRYCTKLPSRELFVTGVDKSASTLMA